MRFSYRSFPYLLFSLVCLLLASLTLAGCGSTTTIMGALPPRQPNPGPTPAPPSPEPSPTPAPQPTPTPTPPTWSPTTSSLPAPPAQEPPPPPSSGFPLTISSPGDGVTVNSPANVIASSTPSNPILGMRVYVDGQAVYWTFESSMNTRIWMDPGAHTLEVMAEDKQGFIAAQVLHVNVVAPQAAGVSDIQTLPDWQSCSAVFPPGSPREGQICAAGLGTAVSTMTQGQSTPSLDGKAAKFTMGGPTGYSNELYYQSLGGGANVTHFTYDLSFFIDQPDRAQALEFDVNQTFGGLRWTWGTECNFKASGKWDIWDPLNETWVPSQVPCNPFPANTWIHLVWNFERVNGQVHYISVSVNGVTSNVDTFFQPQKNWTLEDINVAFQMDGDSKQEPYNVWLDQVSLQVF